MIMMAAEVSALRALNVRSATKIGAFCFTNEG